MKNNFKKHLLTALSLLFVTTVAAHDFEVNGIYYKITNTVENTVAVTYKGNNYTSYSNEYTGNIIIPQSVTYNGISYNVTSIDKYTFYTCTSLNSVRIGENIIDIGKYAFYGCTNLLKIDIPNNVINIGEYVFSNCTGLNSVVLSSNIKNISKGCFQYCTLLTDINIPSGIAIIDDYAFRECINLLNISVPNSVIHIGNYAFYNCDKLESITIPNSVMTIGSYAFSSCSHLTNIEIPDGVESIAAGAFHYCTSLKSIKIPNTIKTISYKMFFHCDSLEYIVIPFGITSVQDEAFAYCSSLLNIIIPNSITLIRTYAFRNCTSLINIKIPESVTDIEDYAFAECTRLESAAIGNGVKNIGVSAFENCTNLKELIIGKSVTNIGNRAFYGCSTLTNITSFIPAENIFEISDDRNYGVFGNINKYNCILQVPFGAKKVYELTSGWNKFTNIVEQEKTFFDLTVTSAGYATLYLDKAVEIPSCVEVYTANAVDGEYLKMQLVENLVPANTGVIIKADADTYIFPYVDYEVLAINNNLLNGTIVNEYINVPTGSKAYVLSIVDGEVGMYLAELNDGRFLNNANKAYLLLSSNGLDIYDDKVIDTSTGGQLSNGFRFDFGGTTTVEDVKTEIGEINAIYDLQGRKVTNPTNGIYIINGKKVLIK